jgi:hypothetical protein
MLETTRGSASTRRRPSDGQLCVVPAASWSVFSLQYRSAQHDCVATATTLPYAGNTRSRVARRLRFSVMRVIVKTGSTVPAWINTIGAVLTHRAEATGDIVKVERGTWGLKEWYPNRSSKKEKDANGPLRPKKSRAGSQPMPASRHGLKRGGFDVARMLSS